MTELKQQIETIQQNFQQHGAQLKDSLLKTALTQKQLTALSGVQAVIAEAVAKLEVLKGTVK